MKVEFDKPKDEAELFDWYAASAPRLDLQFYLDRADVPRGAPGWTELVAMYQLADDLRGPRPGSLSSQRTRVWQAIDAFKSARGWFRPGDTLPPISPTAGTLVGGEVQQRPRPQWELDHIHEYRRTLTLELEAPAWPNVSSMTTSRHRRPAPSSSAKPKLSTRRRSA